MSTIADFNRIDDCDKIDAHCIDGFSDFTLDDSTLCVETSWGKQCIDIEPVIKAKETLTTLYLSPEEDPNCLVYEPERGDNICIHGDDLSRIISMQYLKDVDQETPPSDGDSYVYNSETGLFEPYPLVENITNIQTAIQNIQATLANHENRLQRIEALLTKPDGVPESAKITWGTVNAYYDPEVQINEGSGTVTSLDKDHGLYTHALSSNAYGDSIFG